MRPTANHPNHLWMRWNKSGIFTSKPKTALASVLVVVNDYHESLQVMVSLHALFCIRFFLQGWLTFHFPHKCVRTQEVCIVSKSFHLKAPVCTYCMFKHELKLQTWIHSCHWTQHVFLFHFDFEYKQERGNFFFALDSKLQKINM